MCVGAWRDVGFSCVGKRWVGSGRYNGRNRPFRTTSIEIIVESARTPESPSGIREMGTDAKLALERSGTLHLAASDDCGCGHYSSSPGASSCSHERRRLKPAVSGALRGLPTKMHKRRVR